MKSRSWRTRAIAITLLLAAVATSITTFTPASSAQSKGAARNRLEITRPDENTIGFRLADMHGLEIASGRIVKNEAERSQTMTVTDGGGQLAEILTRQVDDNTIRITVTSRLKNSEWNLDATHIRNLYRALPAKESIKKLDKESLQTLLEIGRARRATIEAIGPALRAQMIEALAGEKSPSAEARVIASSFIAVKAVTESEAGRPRDCIFAAQWYYGMCQIFNPNSPDLCLYEAITEFFECVLLNMIEDLEDLEY